MKLIIPTVFTSLMVLAQDEILSSNSTDGTTLTPINSNSTDSTIITDPSYNAVPLPVNGTTTDTPTSEVASASPSKCKPHNKNQVETPHSVNGVNGTELISPGSTNGTIQEATPEANGSGSFCSESTQGKKLPYNKVGISYNTAQDRVKECPITANPVCYHGNTKDHEERERFPLCWSKNGDFYNCNHQKDGKCSENSLDLSQVCVHDAEGSSNRIYMDLFVYNYEAYPGFIVDPKVIAVHQADTCVKENAADLERTIDTAQ